MRHLDLRNFRKLILTYLINKKKKIVNRKATTRHVLATKKPARKVDQKDKSCVTTPDLKQLTLLVKGKHLENFL